MTHTTLLPSELSFRPAQLQDLSVLVRMLAEDPLGAGRELWTDPVAAGYTEALTAILQDHNNELMVAVHAQVPVGMLQQTFIPCLTHQGGWRSLIEGVRVASGYRSRGVGTAMFHCAIERARARNCVVVQLTTDRSREDARRFYERLGFVPSHYGMKLRL